MSLETRKYELEQLRLTTELFFLPREAYELRIPKAGKLRVISGIYDDKQKFMVGVIQYSGSYPGIYFTPNPVSPSLLSRKGYNGALPYAESVTQDTQISKRNWLLIDFDARRPTGISSTDTEHQKAIDTAYRALQLLEDNGIPKQSVAVADSGNGGHLLIRVDLPNTPETLKLAQDFLKLLYLRFDEGDTDGCINVDQTVSNAARIFKVYGTLVMKGENTEERPWRIARILDYCKEGIIPVPLKKLQDFVKLLPPEDPKKHQNNGYEKLNLSEWLPKHDFPIQRTKREIGKTFYGIDCLLYPAEHKGDAYAIQFDNGGMDAGCFHNSCAGKWKWEDLRKKVEPDYQNKKANQSDDPTLPSIILNNRQLPEITRDALSAVHAVNVIRPHLFTRLAKPVRITTDERRRPMIEELDEASMRGEMARAANYFRINQDGDKTATPPTREVVQDMLAYPHLDFPPLIAVTETPFVRPDGSIFNIEGYDPVTNLYYYPGGFRIPAVPNIPDPEDLKNSVDTFFEPWIDFPFDGWASVATCLSASLSVLIRPMINGAIPLHIFDKPQAGTGASLLTEVISTIVTGSSSSMISIPTDEESIRKMITSVLARGQSINVLDNVDMPLESTALAALLTSSVWQDRLLGTNRAPSFPNKSIWIATGNNVILRGDLPRRSIWCRMDAQEPRPWLRKKEYRHPKLIEWAQSNRTNILSAILTIVRAWVQAGKPEPENLKILGGFEQYSRIVGSILAFIGIQDFMGNIEKLYDEADADSGEWETFLAVWYETFGSKEITTHELVDHLNSTDGLLMRKNKLYDALPNRVADTNIKNYIRILADALKKRKGQSFANQLRLTSPACGHGGAVKWSVIDRNKNTTHTFSMIESVEN